MKRFLLAMAMIVALCGTVYAGGSEQITVADTAVGLTATKYLNAVAAYCYVGSYAIRWTTDSSTPPTSTTGIAQAAATYITLTSRAQIKTFKAIRTTGSSATLDCQYFNAGE